jgi:aldose 1-epimerase
MHGLLAGKVMTVERAVSNQDSAILTLSYDFKNEEAGYPFNWFYQITYTLCDQGLDISITVNNTMDTCALPMYIGWHPYFLCTTHKAIITFDPCTPWNHIILNSNANPTGETTLGAPFDGHTPIGGTASTPTAYDDEYKTTMPPSKCGQIKTKLYDPDTNKTVVLYQSANMRFLQVFTGIVGTVAIEPMSGMADAFNNHDHLSVLSGKEHWQASFGVYLE